MNPSQLLDSMVALHSEVKSTDDIPDEVLDEVRQLDEQMHQMIQSNDLHAEESLSEKLMALETEFAADHPVLEKLVREIIERLAQMGI
jgi:hypothetical protein